MSSNIVTYILNEPRDTEGLQRQLKNIFYDKPTSKFFLEAEPVKYNGHNAVAIKEVNNGYTRILLGYIVLDILSSMVSFRVNYDDIKSCFLKEIKFVHNKYIVCVSIVFSKNTTIQSINTQDNSIIDVTKNTIAPSLPRIKTIRATIDGLQYDGDNRTAWLNENIKNGNIQSGQVGYAYHESNRLSSNALIATILNKKIGYLNIRSVGSFDIEFISKYIDSNKVERLPFRLLFSYNNVLNFYEGFMADILLPIESETQKFCELYDNRNSDFYFDMSYADLGDYYWAEEEKEEYDEW